MQRLAFFFISSLLTASPVAADPIFSLDLDKLDEGTVLTGSTPMAGGSAEMVLTNGTVFKSTDWAKYKYRQLLVSGLTSYPLQEAVFTSKPFSTADRGSVLAVFEGVFLSPATPMGYVLSCGNAALAGFTASGGKLVLRKYNAPDEVFGTYRRSGVVAGKQRLLIHSVFLLVDLKKKTFRVTFNEDGETATTGTRPWTNQQVTVGPYATCKLEALFQKPLKTNRYVLANLGISANK